MSKILLRARGIKNIVNKIDQTNKTRQRNESFHLSSFTLHLLPLALLLLPFTLLLSPDIDQAAQATLAWDSNTKPDPAGYRVCYGSSSRSYYKSVDAGNWPSCTLSGLEEAQTCYFAATAYDIHHNESDFSEEVVYSAPIGILASRGSVHFKAAEGGLRVSGQPFTMDFGGILMK